MRVPPIRFAHVRRGKAEEPPGIVGVARVDLKTKVLVRRLEPGDIAVIDHPDLDRVSADELIACRVAAVVNAVGNSPYWADTAIIITWDDWGGWYDHVAPMVVNSYEYGFRVPLIVVSPYAKAAYISHANHDFGSILKFIEEVFEVPGLGYADAEADDMSDCFNLSQTPLTFRTIPAPFSTERFLRDRRPPTDPDDD